MSVMNIEILAKRIEVLEKQVVALLEEKNINNKKSKSSKVKCDSGYIMHNTFMLITTYNEWIESYSNNNNTGNESEIKTGLSILSGSGLCNNETLPLKYQNIKPYKTFNDIKGIINVSQKDNIGGTGDIGIVFNNNFIKYYSITEKKNKQCNSKCIHNPSGIITYNMKITNETEQLNVKAYEMAIDARKKKAGKFPNKGWKRFQKCPGSKLMCEHLAKTASNSWNKLDKSTRRNILLKLLDLKYKEHNILTTNACGIIFWDSKNNSIAKIYNWTLKINLDDYLTTYSDGIYIYHGTPGNTILRTQAKYNKGIIEGMDSKISPKEWKPKKSNNYMSSWNCNAQDLNKIFNLEEL